MAVVSPITKNRARLAEITSESWVSPASYAASPSPQITSHAQSLPRHFVEHPQHGLPDHHAVQSLPSPQTRSSAPSLGYPSFHFPEPDGAQSPPWCETENCSQLIVRGRSLEPVIHAEIEKGFFFSGDRVWTCYRRNYFAVNAACSNLGQDLGTFGLRDTFISTEQDSIPVTGFGLRLRAEVWNGKTVGLIQHTPKRDKGPQLAVDIQPVGPTFTPAGVLVLENATASWERIQFVSATANNGKRRAQQQYYHLVVELLARTGEDGTEADWLCIASRKSYPLVVRGRSPSHYQNESLHSDARVHKAHAEVDAAFESGALSSLVQYKQDVPPPMPYAYYPSELSSELWSRSHSGYPVDQPSRVHVEEMSSVPETEVQVVRPTRPRAESTDEVSSSQWQKENVSSTTLERSDRDGIVASNMLYPHLGIAAKDAAPALSFVNQRAYGATMAYTNGPDIEKSSPSHTESHEPLVTKIAIDGHAIRDDLSAGSFQEPSMFASSRETEAKAEIVTNIATAKATEIALDLECLDIRDDSSVSSQRSDGTQFSMLDTASTTSSFQPVSLSMEFASFLLRIQRVEPLLKDCFARASPDRCERNIRRLIKGFGTNLMREAVKKSERRAARSLSEHCDMIAADLSTLCAVPSASKVLPVNLVEPYSDFAMSRYLLDRNSEAENLEYAVDNHHRSIVENAGYKKHLGLIDSDRVSFRTPSSQAPSRRGFQFIESSEALEDFHTGLLDFRIAVENTRHNEGVRLNEQFQGVQQDLSSPIGSQTPISHVTLLRTVCERVRNYIRPVVSPGYRRVEWRCVSPRRPLVDMRSHNKIQDCGKLLYADFQDADSTAIDMLEQSLINPGSAPQSPGEGGSNVSMDVSRAIPLQPASAGPSAAVSDLPISISNTAGATSKASGATTVPETKKYLALCITTRNIYKTLLELDVSNVKSDASLFEAMKRSYRKARGYKAWAPSLFKPVSVEFVHVSSSERHRTTSLC
jgi:hypothetical protein